MVQLPTCENVVFASLRDFLVIIVLQQYKFIRMVSGVTDERDDQGWSIKNERIQDDGNFFVLLYYIYYRFVPKRLYIDYHIYSLWHEHGELYSNTLQ